MQLAVVTRIDTQVDDPIDLVEGMVRRAQSGDSDAFEGVYRAHVDRVGHGPLVMPVEAPGNRHVYHLFVVRCFEREQVRDGLASEGIETAIHYPVPVHQQVGYAERCRVGPGGLEATERLSAQIFSLPLFPYLTEDEFERVVGALGSLELPLSFDRVR